MNLIRKLKISDIVPVEFSEHEQGIINLFNDKLTDLVVFINESYPDEINYMKPDGTWIMQLDNKSKKLWIRFDGFWEVLESKFSIEYEDIQILVHSMVGRAFIQKLSTAYPHYTYTNNKVKQKLPTASRIHRFSCSQVEKDFKNKKYH